MEFLLPFLTAFFITSVAVFPTIYWAKKFGLVDNPKLRPHPAHIQNRVIPRAGGLPCFLGISLAILFFLPLEKHILGLLLGLLVLVIIGLLDDKYKDFSPYKRLLIQFLAAGIVVTSGVGISFITNPFGGIIRLDSIIIPFQFIGYHQIIVVADILAILWMVWLMNMINWSKGVDGQMPGIVMVVAIILGLLSLKLYFEGDLNQLNIAKLSFITAGSAFAFLILNWHPAKIFPGFSGSTIFGLIIATLAIFSGAKLATAGLVLLVPATDFIYTFFRRILQGKSPVWGDRGHLHHLLFDKGFSHQQISLFYILGGAILGAVALTLDSRGKLFAIILVSFAILGIILWLNFFGELSKRSDPDSG